MMNDDYFYGEIPSRIYNRQLEATNYLFFTRPKEMRNHSIPGSSEAKWGECTKIKLFLPLFDPQSQMNTEYVLRPFSQ